MFNEFPYKLLSLHGPDGEALLNEVALRVVAEVASSLSISKPCKRFAKLQFVSFALTIEHSHINQIVVHVRVARMRIGKLCVSMSKIVPSRVRFSLSARQSYAHY